MIDRIGNCCTGCQTCGVVCPKRCISFYDNIDGFCKPIINFNDCIRCNLCESVCPAIAELPDTTSNISYAAQFPQKTDKSSSGGVFAFVAKKILESGGVVYGAAFNRGKGIQHIRISDVNDINLLCGSKYVQSYIDSSIFKSLKNDLTRNHQVLFVGTPCQVEGVRLFLKRTYENLILIDLICHGVPSRKLFNDYLTYCESLRHKTIVDFIFRDNREGWNNIFKSTIIYSDGTEEYNSALSNLWNRIFFSEFATRPSCNNCKFSTINRVGDITLGDFWGIKDKDCFIVKNGISLVLCNTNKGAEIIAKGELKYISAMTNEREHPNLYHPTNENKSRDDFMKFYLKYGFRRVINKYFGFNWWLDLKIRTYNHLKNFKR